MTLGLAKRMLLRGDEAKYTVRVSKHHCGQSFGGVGRAREFFSSDFMTFLLMTFFLRKSVRSAQTYIHSHRALNSVPSCTDNMKRFGPIPSSWDSDIPAMHVQV